MGALSALGVAPESPAFPAVVDCPLCQQNTLYLFDDIATDGVWLYCHTCFSHGNIITFGAQIWNTSLPDTLTRLTDLGFIGPGDGDRASGDYERAYTKEQAANVFWDAVAPQIWNHGDDIIAVRLRELGVHAEVPACQGLVGVAHQDQISELCEAMGRAKPVALRNRAPALVFPYYDLPGRFTGFLLVQYDDDFATKTTFVAKSLYRKRKADAGYWQLISALLPATQLLRNRMFIVDDPFWALSAQCLQLKYGQPLLPLAAGYVGSEAMSYGKNWQSFYPVTRLFQGRVSTPELISQACGAKGYVCVTPLDKKDHPRKTPKHTIERLAAINSAAETWQANLISTLTESNELTAFAFATRLRIPHERMQAFFNKYADKFSAKFADKVLDVLKVTPFAPTRVFRRWTLVERDNKWWSQSGAEVCNAKPVISKIIQCDDGEKLYSGQIFFGDEVYDFTDNAEKIERMGLLAYAFAQLAPRGKVVTFDRLWNPKSHLFALQLRPPELEFVASKPGWDDDTSTFRLGNYCITNSGEIAVTPSLPHKKIKIRFPEPTLVAPITIRQFLTPSPQNAFVWNVFSAVAASLIAPILRKDPAGTILCGPAFATATRIGAALNCEQVQTSALRKHESTLFLVGAARKHSWPVFVSNLFNDALFNSAISKCHNQAVLVRMTEEAAVVAAGYGWQSIVGDAPGPDCDFAVLQHVLPTYIQRILKMRMGFAAQHKQLLLGVLHDIHGWLQETYDATFHLPQALSQVITPETAHIALMREINRAIQADKIAVIPRPRRKDQPNNYVLRRKDHWWINRRAVDNYLAAGKNIPPNWLAIIDLMVADGVFAGDETVHHLPGILVATEWCDQFWDNYNPASERETG